MGWSQTLSKGTPFSLAKFFLFSIFPPRPEFWLSLALHMTSPTRQCLAQRAAAASLTPPLDARLSPRLHGRWKERWVLFVGPALTLQPAGCPLGHNYLLLLATSKMKTKSILEVVAVSEDTSASQPPAVTDAQGTNS